MAQGLRISVVIPARDEAAGIGRVIDRAAAGGAHEIIVADGRSADRTVAEARRHGAVVVDAGPGRGRQLNRGAEAAGGDVLLFLHADTLLPPDYVAHVKATLAGEGVCAGAFGLRIDAPGRALRLVEHAVAWRSRRLQRPYGDQALFMTRGTFAAAGGFREWSAMEDYELVRRLRRQGRIAVAAATVLTSGRRWVECGVLRTTLLNQVCITAYRLRVSPERIAGWRWCRTDGVLARLAGHAP